MNQWELYSIMDQDFELINPIGMEKLNLIAKAAKLKEGDRILEIACGTGEMLCDWGEEFGVSGVGVDLREDTLERARVKAKQRGLSDRLEFHVGDGAKFEFEPGSFDMACCVGADFVYGGFRNTIRALRPAIRKGGKVVASQLFWLKSDVPEEIVKLNPDIDHEREIIRTIREEGYELEFLIRTTHDEWDWYERSNWQGLIKWLKENKDHEDYGQVLDWLRNSQQQYLEWGRELFGWAVYLLGESLSV